MLRLSNFASLQPFRVSNSRSLLLPAAASLIILLAFTSAASAHGPSRQKVTKEVVVAAPAAKVWAVIEDFCAIETWHPAVAKCVGEGGNEPGATRVLTLGGDDGPQIHEELQKYSTEKMSYKYKITKTPMEVLPVTALTAASSFSSSGGLLLGWPR